MLKNIYLHLLEISSSPQTISSCVSNIRPLLSSSCSSLPTFTHDLSSSSCSCSLSISSNSCFNSSSSLCYTSSFTKLFSSSLPSSFPSSFSSSSSTSHYCSISKCAILTIKIFKNSTLLYKNLACLNSQFFMSLSLICNKLAILKYYDKMFWNEISNKLTFCLKEKEIYVHIQIRWLALILNSFAKVSFFNSYFLLSCSSFIQNYVFIPISGHSDSNPVSSFDSQIKLEKKMQIKEKVENKKKIIYFYSTDISQICNAFAKLNYFDDKLFSFLATEMVNNIDNYTFSSQSLSNIVNAYAKMNIKNEKLFKILEKIIIEKEKENNYNFFKTQELANILNAYAKLFFDAKEKDDNFEKNHIHNMNINAINNDKSDTCKDSFLLPIQHNNTSSNVSSYSNIFNIFTKNIYNNFEKFIPCEIVMILNAYSKMNIYKKKLFFFFNFYSNKILHKLNGAELSVVANAYAKFNIQNIILFNQISQIFLKNVTFNSTDYNNFFFCNKHNYCSGLSSSDHKFLKTFKNDHTYEDYIELNNSSCNGMANCGDGCIIENNINNYKSNAYNLEKMSFEEKNKNVEKIINFKNAKCSNDILNTTDNSIVENNNNSSIVGIEKVEVKDTFTEEKSKIMQKNSKSKLEECSLLNVCMLLQAYGKLLIKDLNFIYTLLNNIVHTKNIEEKIDSQCIAFIFVSLSKLDIYINNIYIINKLKNIVKKKINTFSDLAVVSILYANIHFPVFDEKFLLFFFRNLEKRKVQSLSFIHQLQVSLYSFYLLSENCKYLKEDKKESREKKSIKNGILQHIKLNDLLLILNLLNRTEKYFDKNRSKNINEIKTSEIQKQISFFLPTDNIFFKPEVRCGPYVLDFLHNSF